jgi:hypothetical protein
MIRVDEPRCKWQAKIDPLRPTYIEPLEKALKTLDLQTAHILGIENLNNWLVMHPTIWSTLGFDRFEKHLKIQTEDLKDHEYQTSQSPSLLGHLLQFRHHQGDD